EGVGATAAALVDLSTVAGNKISNPPWVKFQSAGWVNFPSAPTPDGDFAQPFVTCPWFASHLAVCNLGHMVSFPVANWLPIEIVWLPIRCQLRSAFFESNRAILDEKLAASQ
ncbi:hypothetical protein OHU58_19505, partial [Pseudomonas aeruginosa]|uniref:hypothetical protein n=1 Tax=Pseudomonas aeruginosa TaxID=287 RepID=UPI0021E83FFB